MGEPMGEEVTAQRRITPRRQGAALALLAALTFPSCALVVSFDSFEDPLALPALAPEGGASPDAPRLFGVRGTVTGLGSSKASIRVNAVPLDVSDGPFELGPSLADGAAYVVSVASAPPSGSRRSGRLARARSASRSSCATGPPARSAS